MAICVTVFPKQIVIVHRYLKLPEGNHLKAGSIARSLCECPVGIPRSHFRRFQNKKRENLGDFGIHHDSLETPNECRTYLIVT